jgi:hypothetical protein
MRAAVRRAMKRPIIPIIIQPLDWRGGSTMGGEVMTACAFLKGTENEDIIHF